MDKSLSYFFARPKHWAGLVFMGFAWLIARLPFYIQLKLAKALAWLLEKYAHKRRKIAEINIELCFPEYTENQRKELVKETLFMTALGIIETATSWFSDLKRMEKNTTYKGLENVDKAKANGKGVIMIFFHFTSMEVSGCLMGKKIDFFAMYKPNKKSPLIEYMMRNGRLRHVHGLLTQDDARATIRCLKNGGTIWYATDQNFGNKKGSFVPFFGIKASTVTAITKFAKMSGASVLPVTNVRTNNYAGLEIEVHPAFENFPGENAEADALQINLFLESFLKQHPANYLWIHQRFRTRPEGEPPIYPPKK
ncbi:lipid A biosynthesis lauroyl acyltransferase [Aliikangiella sp. G2MR2-5]|uniref:LpxL/LpxP family acyltransferase n=1 Tax=Aliikangiella sp. G2MR2-5 TaxID=2788943 RepID=UPI0018AA43D4|nr:lipid A biosynthesis lauroyl acyltransferase [Aliikangiella sp. G2MR2-5]